MSTEKLPLMPKATAVWLVDNTRLTFKQIADFVGLHELEISGIADGEVAAGIKGMDPVLNGQLERIELERCEKNPKAKLKLKARAALPKPKRKAPRYTPLSKRQERPSAIAWLVRHHPELADSQIARLVGTTKPTIQSIRERTHWNINNITPTDPVALGMCLQIDLDAAVKKAAAKAAKLRGPEVEDTSGTLLETEASLAPEEPTFDASSLQDEAAAFISGDQETEAEEETVDADAFFNLPDQDGEA